MGSRLGLTTGSTPRMTSVSEACTDAIEFASQWDNGCRGREARLGEAEIARPPRRRFTSGVDQTLEFNLKLFGGRSAHCIGYGVNSVVATG